MGAMAVLLLDRWPGGRGEAWSTGEEGTWLSRGQRMRAEQLQRRAAEEETDADDASPAEDTERSAPRRSKKRKKRRQP
jgi:hypothetical protein